MINGNGKKGLFEDHGWDIPAKGKIDLIKKKNIEASVLALEHPYKTVPINVIIQEIFVPSQQRYVETMQKWERSKINDDGYFVLRNIDPSAEAFGEKNQITNTLLYANDYGMSIGKERKKVTVPVIPKSDGIYFNNNY